MKRIQTIPYFHQENDWFCGPAVVQMLLAGIGIRRTQHRLAREMRTTEADGTKHEELEACVKRFFSSVRTKRRSNFAAMRLAVRQGDWVVVNYVEPVDNLGHYAILRGIHDGMVQLQDPEHGPRYRVPSSLFSRRWVSGDGKAFRWFLCVRPHKYDEATQPKPKR